MHSIPHYYSSFIVGSVVCIMMNVPQPAFSSTEQWCNRRRGVLKYGGNHPAASTPLHLQYYRSTGSCNQDESILPTEPCVLRTFGHDRKLNPCAQSVPKKFRDRLRADKNQ
eukprot:COSAG02_NODE_355_length_24011_cov_28.560932_8_plen_111_part_00